jgi:hypothetical protein
MMDVPEFIVKGVEILNLFVNHCNLGFSFTPDILRRFKFGEDSEEEKFKVRMSFCSELEFTVVFAAEIYCRCFLPCEQR